MRGLNDKSALFAIMSLVFCFSSSLAYAKSDNLAKTSTIENPLPVSVMAIVESSDYDILVEYLGRIEAQKESSLSFNRNGHIRSIQISEGDVVKRNQNLAVLDTRNLVLQKNEAAATQKSAQGILDELNVQLATERKELNRQKALADAKVISQQTLERYETKVAALEARIISASANADQILSSAEILELNKQESVLRAPFEGTIVEAKFENGAFVRLGETVFSLIDDQNLQFRISLPIPTFKTLTLEESYTIKYDDKYVKAQLKSQLPFIHANSNNIVVLFDIEKTDADVIFHGQLATLLLEKKMASKGFWLPIESLSEGARDLWTVFVVVREDEAGAIGRLESRSINVMEVSDTRVFVTGAINRSDLVVTSGIHRLSKGMAVKILKPSSDLRQQR